MQLFHYHYWTNQVEETERFYSEIGFTTKMRMANAKGVLKQYNPPLDWDDFRHLELPFRIIEMRKGKINFTFGSGKRPIFDHIGFLVTHEEHDTAIKNAESIGWKTEVGERRSFIHTPFRLRIELQRRSDVVEQGDEKILRMTINVQNLKGIEQLPYLFGREIDEIVFEQGESLALKNVHISGEENAVLTDPNGVNLIFENHS